MEMTTRQTLTILHTNDIHSHFGSMPSIAAMIDERRAASRCAACARHRRPHGPDGPRNGRNARWGKCGCD